MPNVSSEPIKRLPDGSIDTIHYMQVGRQLRSDEVYKMAKAMFAHVAGRPRVSVWLMRPFSARLQ